MQAKNHGEKVYASREEEQLRGEFGAPFEVTGKEPEERRTPAENIQRFIHRVCRLLDSRARRHRLLDLEAASVVQPPQQPPF